MFIFERFDDEIFSLSVIGDQLRIGGYLIEDFSKILSHDEVGDADLISMLHELGDGIDGVKAVPPEVIVVGRNGHSSSGRPANDRSDGLEQGFRCFHLAGGDSGVVDVQSDGGVIWKSEIFNLFACYYS